jgi:small-conductance mechanosensitive channel
MESLLEWWRRSGAEAWLEAAALFLVVAVLTTLVRRVVWGRLARHAATTDTTWDDLLLDASRAPANLLIFIASLALALQVAPPSARDHGLARHGPRLLLVLCVLWMIERFAAATFEAKPLQGRISESGRRLWLTVVRLLVVVVGLLVMMDTLGLNVTPLLASLGVGSLAVALGVQETLANFFAGLYLLVDRPVRIGDNVRLEDGTEGVVATIGWRSTHVRLATNSMMVMPNTKLSSARLTNFDLPDPEYLVVVPAGVAYGQDLARVEAAALDVARAVQSTHAGAVAGFSPVVRFTAMADAAVTFNVVVRARSYESSGALRSELVKALHARFVEEGLEGPPAQRTVRVVGGGPGS